MAAIPDGQLTLPVRVQHCLITTPQDRRIEISPQLLFKREIRS
jgi:hypothetical protein